MLLRTCLAETDIEKLEDLWRELDERWMLIKHWIDLVPDIEYGECFLLALRVETVHDEHHGDP
jgi:hypothetical protein